MASVEYYYASNAGERLGPVSPRQLKSLADQGDVAPDTLIWKEGLIDWIPASKAKGLFPESKPRTAQEDIFSAEPANSAVYAVDGIELATGSTQPAEWYIAQGKRPDGPYTQSQIIDAIQQGNVASHTLLWKEHMPTWLPAADLAPFRPSFGPTTFTRPQRPKSIGDDAGVRMLLPVGRSIWAVAAGYLGLFSLLGIFAPFAILTGVIAIFDIRRNPHKHGMGRAIFGITIGSIVLLLILVAIIADLS